MRSRLLRANARRIALFATVVSSALLSAAATSHFRPVYAAPPGDAARKAAPGFVGNVTDKATGRPLTSATVALFYAHPRVGTSPFCPSCYPDCQKREKTDAAGQFRMAAPNHALLFTVLVVHSGYAPRFFRNVDPSKVMPTFKLTPNGVRDADFSHSLRGRVVDAAGHPVADAILEPNGLSHGDSRTFGGLPAGVEPLVVSDSDGSFVFHAPNTASTMLIEVDARGFAPRLSGWLPVGAPPITLRLGVGASLAGRVVGPSGKAIPGVVFEAVQADRNSESFVGAHYIGTNPGGGFVLTNVLPGTPHVVCVHSNGPLAAANLAVPQCAITTAADGATNSLSVLHAVPAVSMKGMLVLPPGKPVPAGTRLLLDRDGTWDTQNAIVAPNGAFAFRGIPPGEKMTLTVSVRGCHLAKTADSLDAISPQYGNIQFTAPAAGAMPDRTIVLEADQGQK